MSEAIKRDLINMIPSRLIGLGQPALLLLHLVATMATQRAGSPSLVAIHSRKSSEILAALWSGGCGGSGAGDRQGGYHNILSLLWLLSQSTDTEHCHSERMWVMKGAIGGGGGGDTHACRCESLLRFPGADMVGCDVWGRNRPGLKGITGELGVVRWKPRHPTLASVPLSVCGSGCGWLEGSSGSSSSSGGSEWVNAWVCEREL